MEALERLGDLLPMVGRRSLRGLRRGVVPLAVNTVVFLLSLLWFVAMGETYDDDVAFAMGVAAFFVHPVLFAGLTLTGLLAVRGGRAMVRTLFEAFWPPGRWLRNLGLALALGTGVAVGVMLLILPGLVLLGRLGFSFFYVNHHAESPVAALRNSWELTRGRTVELTLLVLLSVGLLVGGSLVYGVGAIPALMFLLVAWAAVFDVLWEEKALEGVAEADDQRAG